jgi:hypothetical protein
LAGVRISDILLPINRAEVSFDITNGTDMELTVERLARIEGVYEHLATTADLERFRADIEKSMPSLIKWMVGIAVALFIPIYGVLITIPILLLNK